MSPSAGDGHQERQGLTRPCWGCLRFVSLEATALPCPRPNVAAPVLCGLPPVKRAHGLRRCLCALAPRSPRRTPASVGARSVACSPRPHSSTARSSRAMPPSQAPRTATSGEGGFPQGRRSDVMASDGLGLPKALPARETRSEQTPARRPEDRTF